MSVTQKLQHEDIKLREADQAPAEDAAEQNSWTKVDEQNSDMKLTADDEAIVIPCPSASKGKDESSSILKRQETTVQKNKDLNYLLLALLITISAFALRLTFIFPDWAQTLGIDYITGLACCALPWQIVWTIWQLRINRELGKILHRPSSVSSWEIVIASCVGFLNLPLDCHFDNPFQDPFMWIWAASLSWFYLRVAPSVLALKDAKSSLKHGLLLACLSNAFIPIALIFSGLIVPAAKFYFASIGINTPLPDVSNIVVINNSTAMWFQTVGLAFLSLLLQAQTKGPAAVSNNDSIRGVKAEPSQITIPFRPFAGIERWTERSVKRRGRSVVEYMLLSFTLPIAYVIYLCWCFSPIPMEIGLLLGISDRAQTTVQSTIKQDSKPQSPDFSGSPLMKRPVPDLANEEEMSGNGVKRTLVGGILGMLAALMGGSWLYYISKPTEIILGQKGIRFNWRRKSISKDSAWIDWQEITNIELSKQSLKSVALSEAILFHRKEGRPIRIPLSSVDTVEQRQAILQGIQLYAADVTRDACLVETLEPASDHSYTELWLQALSAPPKRERLKPLENGLDLREHRYTIEKTLGVGGQGHAYLAADHENACQVVLKEFILPVYVDVDVRKSALQQFENEAKILMSLRHPQIVELKDFFIEDHRAYLVLEHIEGISLRELVREKGRLSEQQAKELCNQMCDILQYLHGQSPAIVHRDFTPDNLILRKDGILKLIDFNVARQLDKGSLGTIVGKHAYMPPEQFRGEAIAQSDIYALGASLFFLLTGSDPEPISQSTTRGHVDGLSELLNGIVEKATCLELAQRIQSASEIKDTLELGSQPEDSSLS